MGYRGSKSVNTTVKEQRVDGSWFLAYPAQQRKARSLRCTLMGLERDYQVKIPSKQLNNIFYFSTLTNNNENNIIKPWFFTGRLRQISLPPVSKALSAVACASAAPIAKASLGKRGGGFLSLAQAEHERKRARKPTGAGDVFIFQLNKTKI